MAEEEETREVLFPDWEGPDKTGLTIEQTSGGELYVKEVKGESPAARSGKVYEGDQIVGATVYFDNMSSEETAELLKTLNRHKVGLKLQNKSPCCSPLSTPCRSPIGTLTWEGKTRFGGSSPDIILSGEDEDYKRIYTKKIKPRLKSEDLAEGVDVRTERHSSTSSDGSTITTITRRITTYTVDMPGGISEHLELSSPEFKGLKHESGDGSPHIRISHGSPSGKVGIEESVFEASNISYTGPQVSITETHSVSGGVQTREVEREKGAYPGFKGSNFGVTGVKGQGDLESSRGRGEQGDRSIQVSGTSMTLRDSTNTGSKHVSIGGLVGAEITSTDENGGSISMSLPGKSMQILTSSTDKTQEGSVDTSLSGGTKVKVSETTISHPQAKKSGSTDIQNVRLDGGSILTDADLRSGRIGGSAITVGTVTSGYSSRPGKISVAGVDVNLTGSKLKGDVDVNLPSTKGVIKPSGIDAEVPGYEKGQTGTDSLPSANIKGPVVSVSLPEADYEAPEINSGIQTNVPKVDSKYKMEVSKVKKLSLSGPDTDLNVRSSKADGDIDVAALKPEGELRAPKIDIKGAKEPKVDIKPLKVGIKAPEVDGEGVKSKVSSKTGPTTPEWDIGLKGSKVEGDVDMSFPKIVGHTTKPEAESKGPADYGRPKGRFEMPGIEIKASKVNVTSPDVDIDIERADAKLKGDKFKVPTISGTKMSMPSVNLRGPELKGHLDVSEKDMKTPGIEIKDSGINVKGPKIGFEKTEINVPPTDIKGPRLEGSDVDITLPKDNTDVKPPGVVIKGPEFDIKGQKIGFDKPKIKMPTIDIKGPKVEGPDVDINLSKTNIDGKAPEIVIKGAKLENKDVDMNVAKANIDVKAPKVDIKGPKVDVKGLNSTDMDLNLRGLTLKGDVDVSVPKIKGDIETPEIDIKGPKVEVPDVDAKLAEGNIDVNIKSPKIDMKGPDVDTEGHVGGFKMPKIKVPSIGLKGPNFEGPEVDVSLPKAKIDIGAAELDIKGPDVNIERQGGKILGPNINMPTISGPNVDFNLRGPSLKGDSDVKVPNIEGDLKGPEVNIKGPQVDTEGPKGGFGLPKVKLPLFGIQRQKVESPDVDINLPKGKIDVDIKPPKVEGPEVDIKAPKIDIKGAQVDIEGPKGGFEMSKIKMPSLNIKGPEVEGPDVDLNLPKGKIDVDIKPPKIDIEGPEVDMEGHKGGIKMPKFKIPSFGLKGPKLEGPEVDVSLPKADIDIKAPELDIQGPDVDIESPSGKLKGPKFSMPNISGPKLSMPDVDFKLKGPKLKGDVDVSVPKIEGDIKAPDVDIKGPQVDIEGPKGGFELPKFKMPSLNIKGPKVEGPDIDVDLPKGKIDVDIKTPKVDIEGPEVDMEGHKGGIKMPKFKVPSFGLKGPKLEGPEVDVSLPKADIDIKAPELDIQGPDVDIESPSGKFKGPKFSMPSISGPKLSMPDMDFNLRGPRLKGDVDVSVPKIEGDIKAPDVDIKGPQVDIEGSKGGFELPKFKMPSLNIKGPKVEGPDVDVDLPKGKIDVDIKSPKMDIEGPEVDIEGHTGGFKMPKFHLPSIGLKGPKFESPEVDVSLPKAEIGIKAPEVDIKGPQVDIEGPEGRFDMPTIKMPSFGSQGPKVEGPDVDVNLPKGKIDVDIKSPKMDIEGPDVDIEGHTGGFKMPKFHLPSIGLKGPKFESPEVDVNLPKAEIGIKAPEVDIKGPQVDIEGPKVGFDMPTIKMPSFGFQGPKVEGPDIDVNVPKGKIDVSASGVDIQGPQIDIEGPDSKVKGPKFKMPTVSGPQLSMPTVDFNLRGPKLKGDVGMSVPKIEGDIKNPDVSIKGPQIKGPKGQFDMPKIKMPSADFKGPKMEGPGIDINIPKSNADVKVPDVDINLKGKMDASVPKMKADIKGPDASVAVPTITMEGVSLDPAKTGVTFPKFKGPKFGMKSQEVEGKTPTLSVGVKGSKTEVSLPDTEASLDAPDIDINVRGKKGKFKFPKGKGKSKKPGIDIEIPAIDLDADTPNIHVKGTKVKKPLFGKLHFPDVELDIKSPKMKGDGSLSEGFKSPDIEFPSASFNTTVEGSGIGSPNVNLGGADVKLKTPNIKMSNVNVSTSDVDTNLNRQGEASMSAGFKGPKINLKGGAGIDTTGSGASASGGLNYPEGTVTFPKIKVPKFGIALPQVESQGDGGNVESASGGISIQSPSISCQVSSQNIEVPSPELRHSEGKVKVKMPKLFGKSKAKGSSASDLQGPEVELSTSGGGGKFEAEGDPRLSVSAKGKSASLDLFQRSRHRSSSLSDEGGLAVSSPSTHLEAEGGDISLDLGGGKVKGKKGKLKFGTFGGFGSKSKGSYEVSLGEEGEAGAGVSLPSKKSRLSSSSSSDSGSRGGFRFPRLELSVSPKK